MDGTSAKLCRSLPMTAAAATDPKDFSRSATTGLRMQLEASDTFVGDTSTCGWVMSRPHSSVIDMRILLVSLCCANNDMRSTVLLLLLLGAEKQQSLAVRSNTWIASPTATDEWNLQQNSSEKECMHAYQPLLSHNIVCSAAMGH